VTLLLRSSLRYFMRHPWQLLLAIAGIALGVAVITAIDIANSSAKRAFALSMDGIAGAATHQIVGGPDGLDERIYTRLRLSGVRAAAPLIEAHGVAGGETLRVLGVDPLAEGAFRDTLGNTRGDDSGELIVLPNSAFLAEPTARRLAVDIGDLLELRLGARMHTLRIIGVIEAGDHAAAIEGLLVTDIATAQELTGMIGRLGWIDLKLPDGRAGEESRQRIEALLPPAAEIVPAEARTRSLSAMSRAFHTNLTAMSLLALVVGMFLIYNTMAFAVVQRRGLIASQRLIGVTRGEVLTTVLIEALVIGAVGTLIGIGAGVFLGQMLLSLVTRTINDLYFVVTVTTLQLSAGPFLIAALLGLAATLVAAFTPALEAALTPPRAALHRSTLEAKSHRLMPRLALAGVFAIASALLVIVVSGRSLLAGFAGLFLIILGMTFLTPMIASVLARSAGSLLAPLGIALRHAIRGITDALSRTGVALAALMLAVATTIGVGLMIDSFRVSVSEWLEASLQADIYVSAPGLGSRRTHGALDPLLIDRILALPDIAFHSTGRSVSIETGDGFTDVFVLGLSPGLVPRYPLKDARPDEVWPAFRRAEAVLISEPMAWHRGLAPGDTIELRTRDGLRSFPVAGIYYDYSSGQGEVLMPRDLYERHFDDRGTGGLGLYLAPGAEIDAALQSVRAVIASRDPAAAINLRSNRELRELSMSIFDRTFTITEVLRLLAVGVAIIGILGALMALQLERMVEIGVLRSLGFTPGQILGMVTLQTGLMGLIAGLIAIPTGLLLSLLLIRVINERSFGWSMQALVSPDILINGLMTAVLAAVVAGLYPAWKMSRASPATALREG
jgi:putative ABC transport system permease protein